jgi:hypothetical protein
LVQVQPGQSRSWQASSESCHSPGNWWVRSVDSEEAGRVDSAPKSLIVAGAEAVSLAEGSIRATVNARSSGAAGVPSPGHAFKGILQELGRPSCLLPHDRVRSTRQQGARPGQVRMHRPRERKSIRREVTVRSRETGDCREGHGGVLRTHSTDEGGELAIAGTHWREGVNKRT